MRLRTFVAVPIALLASQAVAQRWIAVGTDPTGNSVFIDKDGIRRGSDGFVYFSAESLAEKSAKAADCTKRQLYILGTLDVRRSRHKNFPKWREHGVTVKSGSLEESELRYVCVARSRSV